MRPPNWTIINFGKFAGKKMTLPQIVLTDPDWFWHMIEKDAFTGPSARQSRNIARKARKILIPGKSHKRSKVRNYLTPEGSFSHFDVFNAEAASDPRSATALISDFIDLSIPHRLKPYDKSGGRRLIRGLKYRLYGRTNVRLTKNRCEKFFTTPDNFGG